MKILLTAANTTNDGVYVDAGTEITVGDAPNQIDADRAAGLAAAHGRADEVGAKKSAKD